MIMVELNWLISICILGVLTRFVSLLLRTPLLGDDLYGGSLDYGIERQALHCHRLAFVDPFTKRDVHASSLTDDFETVIMNLQTKKD